MDQLPSNLASSPSSSSGLGILSSLSSALGSRSTSSDFDSVLNQSRAAVSTDTTKTSAAQDKGDAVTPAPANQPVTTASIKRLISGLHQTIAKLNAARNATTTGAAKASRIAGQSSSGARDDQTGSGTPARAAAGGVTISNSSTADAGSANANGSGATPASFIASSGTAGASAADDGTDASGPAGAASLQSLTGLLTQILALLQGMEKKLEATQNAMGSTSDPSQANASATQDATSGGADASQASSSATDPLAQLAALMQQLQQQFPLTAAPAALTSASGDGTAAPVAATGADAALGPALLAQLQGQLKSYLNDLQKDLGGTAGGSLATASSDPSSGAALRDVTATLGKLNALPNLPLSAANAQAPTKPAWASADDFSKVFGDTGLKSQAAEVNASFASVSDTLATAAVNHDGLLGSAGDSGSDGSTSSDNGSGNSSGNAGTSASSAAPTNLLPSGLEAPKAADPYTFASQLSATRAANGGTTGLPSTVDQVLLQINRGVKDGNDRMTIQLHPADLGKINISLNIDDDGKVQGTVVANNPATLDTLLKDVRSLERALQDAGLRADPGSLQFSLGGQQQNTPGQTGSDLASNSSPGTKGVTSADSLLGSSADTSESWYVTPGRVNLKV